MSKRKRSIRDKATKAKKVVKLGPAQIPIQGIFGSGIYFIEFDSTPLA